MKKLVLVLLFVTTFSKVVLANSFSGQSDYKLLFIHHPSPEFDPNQDVLNPSQKELEIEKIEEKVGGALMKSLIPLMGNITGSFTGSEVNLFSLLLTTSSTLSKTLSKELSQLKNSDASIFPVIQDAFLVPWQKEKKDLFYGAQKISMQAGELVNVLGVMPASQKFDNLLTLNIKELQKNLYKNSKDSSFLLGMRFFLWIHENAARLTVRILLGLKPGSFPFSEKNDRVHLERVVIPEVPERGGVASLTLNMDLSQDAEEPYMDIEFGDFEKFENGDFSLKEGGKQKTTPRLEGVHAKIKRVAINFSFTDLKLNLLTQKVSDLHTLVSPGLKIGNKNKVIGGLHLTSVDGELQGEINKSIQAKMESSGDSFMNKLLGKRSE